MKINQELYHMLLDQYNEEHLNDAIYQSMENWCKFNGFDGHAHWMHIQALEEREHAEKIKTFLEAVGEKVIKREVPAPATEFVSIEDIWAKGVDAEERTTQNIYDIFYKAREVKDAWTEDFINWFIEEQREEEENFKGNLAKAQRCAANCYMDLDKECARRKA